ncbi:MAG: PAS domain-containing protein [Alphaproteobacteria bacterium]|nr:PAS domain-containing protein [Alphaproteobacteria bacterium]
MRVPFNRWLPTTAFAALPAGVVLAFLAIVGALSFWAALAAWLAIAIGCAILLHRHVGQFLSVRAALEGLMGRAPPADPPASPDPFELVQSTRRLAHDWRRKDEIILRLARENESILDSLPDAILVLDRDRLIRRANKAAERLLGANLAGREFAAVLRHPRLLEAVGTVAKGGTSRDVEIELAGRVTVNLRAHVEAVHRPVGDESWILLSLHDQTAIKRTEQMRADFVANASHELRTPLSALLGFIETLVAGAGEDAATRQRFLGIMGDQAARMSRLVNDLLSLSRIEMREHTAPTDAVELGAVVGGVADALQFRARDRNIALQLHIAADLPRVAGDAEELTQVVQNLVDNAIKYARPGTDVTISVTADKGSEVAIAVADKGEGIPRQHLPRLTERFYRIDAARSRELGGTGLGLAIVKHVVNRHRGRLDVASTLGAGSVFTVSLPSIPADKNRAEARSPDETTPPT